MKYYLRILYYAFQTQNNIKPIKMASSDNTISVDNLHHHIKYDDYDIDGDVLVITWDDENEILDDLMNEEIRPTLGSKLNLMWIEKLKEKANWKENTEELYAYVKNNCDGAFYVWYSKNKKDIGFVDIIIEKNGYVSRNYFNLYNWDTTDDIKHRNYIRTESVYNDCNCDKIKK